MLAKLYLPVIEKLLNYSETDYIQPRDIKIYY